MQLLRSGHNTAIVGTTSRAMLNFRKRINDKLEEKMVAVYRCLEHGALNPVGVNAWCSGSLLGNEEDPL